MELEADNSQLEAIAAESTEAISMLHGTVNAGIEDYELLMDGNKSLNPKICRLSLRRFVLMLRK
jgi:hypothetical protein